ncbi:MAG: DUF4932 domain-containing protein [Planctomycetes bacterium]|nr:DUF4932 domain-containing protein [Planctomycetota bacterium]
MQVFPWILCGVFALLFQVPARSQAPSEPPVRALDVRVDPRIELIAAVARLAGFSEYRMANSASPYSARVDAHFARWADHPVVASLQRLRAERGVSYDALPSLAVHLGPLPELVERIPFDRAPERLDARWGGVGARPFLAELRDFVAQSHAAEFFAGERELYAKTEARLAETLSTSRALPWFDAFFGVKQGASYVAIPGLLCGGGNFGVGVRFDDGTPEEVLPVFGCWSFDADGVPKFDRSYLPLCVHELAHTYTNPFVDRFAKELTAAGDRLHASCATKMQRQGYGNGRTLLYESLVRASVVRCRLATEGEAAAKQQAAEERARHFRWVPELAELYGEYERDRERYPTFEAFMPRIVEFFERIAKDAKSEGEGAPKLVSIEPASGAQDVDPSATVMTIRFDRPMRDRSWSIVGAKRDTPEISGELAYDAERKVLTVPIRLEAGRTYRFSLNSDTKRGFVGADGVPLEPIEVTFTTRP